MSGEKPKILIDSNIARMSTQTPVPIQCKFCGFTFRYFCGNSETGTVAVADCPACGCGNEYHHGVNERASAPVETYQSEVLSATTAVHESARDKARSLTVRRRRSFVLTWTVLLQCCILAGTILFAVKTCFVLDKQVTETVAAETHSAEANSSVVQVPTTVEIPPLTDDTVTVSPPITPFELEPIDKIPLPEIVAADVPPNKELVEPKLLTGLPPEQREQIDNAPVEKPQPTLADAQALLAQSAQPFQSSPEESVAKIGEAVRIYKSLGQPLPESFYWSIGKAYTTLTWGKTLADGIPAVDIMELSRDNRLLVTQLRNKMVLLWDVSDFAKNGDASATVLDNSGKQYIRFCFTPDKHWIIAGQNDGTIRIWDASLKNPAETSAEFREKIPGIADMQISNDGHYLAVRSSADIPDFAGQTKNVIQQVMFKARSENAATRNGSERNEMPVAGGHQVFIWDLRNLDTGLVPSAVSIQSLPENVKAIRFSPDSEKLAVGGNDGVLRIYELSGDGISNTPRFFRGHLLPITHINFAPNGQWLATGSQDNTVRLWNLKSTQLSPESVVLEGHAGWISALAIDALGEHVYSGGYDSTVKCWKVTGNKIESAVNNMSTIVGNAVENTAFGIADRIIPVPDGSKVIINDRSGILRINEVPKDNQPASENTIVFRNSTLPITDCLMAQDGNWLIFCYENVMSSNNSGSRLWHLNAAGLAGLNGD
jgi:WD40 repeat protein